MDPIMPELWALLKGMTGEAVGGGIVVLILAGLYLHPRIAKHFYKKGFNEGFKKSEGAEIKKDIEEMKELLRDLSASVADKESLSELRRDILPVVKRSINHEIRLARLEDFAGFTPISESNGEHT